MKKLYIAILDEEYYADPAHSMLSIAHVTLIAHLRFKDNPVYQDWLENSFRKCLVLVNRKEFNKICELPNVVVATEQACGNRPLTVAVRPREDVPNVLKFAKLFKPS